MPEHAVIQAPLKGAIYPSGNENRGCVAARADAPGHVAAVAMITFNRPTYLRKAVDSLLRVHRKEPSYTCAFIQSVTHARELRIIFVDVP